MQGVAGVRVYLEDGRYSVTDEEGKYHFEDVTPGAHVVQIDTVTIPDTHQPLECAQIACARGPGLFRVRRRARWCTCGARDFTLERKPLPKGAVALQLEPRHGKRLRAWRHSIELEVQQPWQSTKARVLVMLPEGLQVCGRQRARLQRADASSRRVQIRC